MTKMTLDDLKNFFPPYIPGKPKKGATKKGAIHKHRPTWKPKPAAISPALWKYVRRKAANIKKARIADERAKRRALKRA